jgi:hypothetical protein
MRRYRLRPRQRERMTAALRAMGELDAQDQEEFCATWPDCDRSVVVADELISSFTNRRMARLAEHCLRQAVALDVIRVTGTFAARHLCRVAFSEPLVASPAL